MKKKIKEVHLDVDRPLAHAYTLASMLAEELTLEGDTATHLAALIDGLYSEIIAQEEERDWKVTEDGIELDETIVASSAKEALDEACENVDRDNYGADPNVTFRVHVSVECELTGEEDSRTAQIDPDEPECSAKEHEWKSPHSIVGGCESNPGVWGNGGGVVIHEVCMRCGCGRTTDTWAQDRDTGEQGLTEVSYEPGKYSDEIPTPQMETMDAYGLGCSDLAAGAAYVLGCLQGNDSDRPLDRLSDEHRARAVEVSEFVCAQRNDRAKRLALRMAARNQRELAAARSIGIEMDYLAIDGEWAPFGA